MSSIKDFFNGDQADNTKGIVHKNNLIKKSIMGYMAVRGQVTLAELAKELHISVPTITKLVGELVREGVVGDLGKVETAGGRRPNVFGLTNTALYFAGVDISRDSIRYVICDLKNNIIKEHVDHDVILQDTPASLDDICRRINLFLDNSGIGRAKILGAGVCIVGRVNPTTGRSYKYFASEKQPLAEAIQSKIGMKVRLENNTRARCFAEYSLRGDGQKKEKDILYLHLGRGVALGMVLGGKLYYGKSAFAGEFGHTPFFDNEIICSCGKKGCLETEVSGMAVESKISALIAQGRNTILCKGRGNKPIHVDEVIAAAKQEDSLAIELIEELGEKAGKSVAFLINIFNPETVIIGGNLAQAGDYLMLPLLSAVNKHSLNLVYKDTNFRLSQLGEYTGAQGAAMLMRNAVVGI